MAVRKTGGTSQPDLFSADRSHFMRHELSSFDWPDQDRFPVNHAREWLRRLLWEDLTSSPDVTVVAGFASLSELIELIHVWARRNASGELRLVLGSEPFSTERVTFGSRNSSVTQDARAYWLEQGISILHSAKLIEVIGLIEARRVLPRAVPGPTRVHAKVYVGKDAATLGSSNFTKAGLVHQFEANARFTREHEAERYAGAVQIADNYWSAGESCGDALIDLLRELLQVVSWREAVARACAELLEGEWAARYVAADHSYDTLWPSQQLGIAQALWIAENVGSVLVADATGSGKTRMGAHLLRALTERLWRTGRVRQGISAVVSPPAVLKTWQTEALQCGVPVYPISHGGLSRDNSSALPRNEQQAIAAAQILAVDEAHNFLNETSKRTQRLQENSADHVVLFTATPINRDAGDLLQLVSLLGADNFTDETLTILDRLERRRVKSSALDDVERDQLRREIQRFTVRRTKAQLNSLVDRDEGAYRDGGTGRVSRYPDHESLMYDTGETEADVARAMRIREIVDGLLGIAFLGKVIEIPESLRPDVAEPQWLEWRLGSARGLARHRVMSELASSRAAAVEHVAGTHAARDMFDLPMFKPGVTGDMISRLTELEVTGPPDARLTCELPLWLVDASQWAIECAAERQRYQLMLTEIGQVSGAREATKARLLLELSHRHDRVLAFDHHPATLAVLDRELKLLGIDAIVATGSAAAQRRRVESVFAAQSDVRGVALCSDAMSEGLNLQGASAIVQLDLPTTLRVVEQRVGRVDRMNSPFSRIEVWWPNDSPAFRTRANDLLAERAEESAGLLGSNLVVPGASSENRLLEVSSVIHEAESIRDSAWDGISDALDPVRKLVSGDSALISSRIYDEHRARRGRVLARVAPVRASTAWAFFSVAGAEHGAPRWLLIEDGRSALVDLDRVATRLRELLREDPPGRKLDEDAVTELDRMLRVAARHEVELLPRRLQRALAQMNELTSYWAETESDIERSHQWRAIHALISPEVALERGGGRPDPHSIAQRWIELVRPAIDQSRRALRRRRRRYPVLSDATPSLRINPLSLELVQAAMGDLPIVPPLDQRVRACVLGVP